MEEENGMNEGGNVPAGTENAMNAGAGADNAVPAENYGNTGDAGRAPSQEREMSAFGEGDAKSLPEEARAWTEKLPEELRNSPHLKSFRSAEDVVKSYVSLCSLAGKKGLMPPPEGASKAEQDAYLNARRGGISSPKEYSVRFEDLKPYGMTEEAYRGICENLFSAGLSDREQNSVMRTFAQYINYERDAWIRRNNAECERALIQARHEWGLDFDARIESVKRLMNAFPEAKKAIESMGVQNNFAVLDMLAKFASYAKEDRAPGTRGKTAFADAKEIDAQLRALTDSDAYRDASSPAHKRAMEQFWSLMERKASDETR